jgi:hypothetical protein
MILGTVLAVGPPVPDRTKSDTLVLQKCSVEKLLKFRQFVKTLRSTKNCNARRRRRRRI